MWFGGSFWLILTNTLEKVVENLSDWSGALGLVRLTTELAAFKSKLTGVIMFKLMDDGIVVVHAKHWTELWLRWVDFSCRRSAVRN